MKKYLLNLGLIVTLGVIAVSCNGPELEKRISDLERRVATIENGGTAVAPATSTNPATPVVTASTTPEVEVKPDGPLPNFQFAKTEHDFGSINEGDVVNHTFEFTNTGESPLIIESAKASCGCTVPRWPREPIPVGGAAQIEVSFNSKGKPGTQNKTVTITANTYPKITKLNIKSTVLKSADGPS